jgi:hypothetical protein
MQKFFWGGILPGPGVPRGLGRIPGREGNNRTRPKDGVGARPGSGAASPLDAPPHDRPRASHGRLSPCAPWPEDLSPSIAPSPGSPSLAPALASLTSPPYLRERTWRVASRRPPPHLSLPTSLLAPYPGRVACAVGSDGCDRCHPSSLLRAALRGVASAF